MLQPVTASLFGRSAHPTAFGSAKAAMPLLISFGANFDDFSKSEASNKAEKAAKQIFDDAKELIQSQKKYEDEIKEKDKLFIKNVGLIKALLDETIIEQQPSTGRWRNSLLFYQR